MNEIKYPAKWAVIALIPLGYVLYRLFFFPRGFEFFPVDGGVYARGLTDWLAGADPYLSGPDERMLFNYPPVFLYVGGILARLLTPHLGWTVYLLAHFAAVGSLPLILHRFFLRGQDCTLTGVYWLFFAAPGFLGLVTAEIANIAAICYAVMLLAAIPGLTKNRWLLFCIAVFLCASIKITFLALLLLPILCGEKQWLNVATSVVASALGLAGQRWFLPELYAHWLHNLTEQNETFGDVGVGVFGIVFHVLHKMQSESFLLPMAAYAAVSFAILSLLIWLWWRGHNTFEAWPALVLTGVLLMTPRISYYDLSICSPLAFVVGVSALRLRPPMIYGLYLCLLAPSIAFTKLTPYNRVLNGGFETVTILIFFFFACAALSKGSMRSTERGRMRRTRVGLERWSRPALPPFDP